jgi:putative cell wall-binding protein
MKKNGKKVLSACSIASLLITTTAVSTNVKAVSSSENRLGGANRYETAAKISQSGWTTSDYAIVANGEGYADALCASPLAKANNAPILLTTNGSLSQNALDELKRLNVKHVIVVGGTGVVSDSVLNSIKAQVTDVERIGGQDRYETSVKIAEKLGTVTKVVVASGEGYADALSTGPAAAINGVPIILTRSNILPNVTSNYIKANPQITQTYVIGGTAAVSNSAVNSLPSVKRLGGQDRYATNIAVLKEFASSFNFSSIYTALGSGPIGNEFADAITGGALAAKNRSPLVITGKALSSVTTDFLKEKGFTNSILIVLGGTANISDAMASEIKGSIGSKSSGGGGGSGYSDLTDDVSRYYASKIGDAISQDANLSKYFTANTTNGITFTVNKTYSDKVVSYETMFDNKDNADVDTIKGRLDAAYDLLSAHINIINIDGDKNKTFEYYLKQEKAKDSESKFSQYIKEDGTIDTQALAEKVHARQITYADYEEFVGNLKSAMKDSIDLTQPSPTLHFNGTLLNITRIDENSDTLYDSSNSRSANIDSILSSTSPLGSYRIFVASNQYFIITIQK